MVRDMNKAYFHPIIMSKSDFRPVGLPVNEVEDWIAGAFESEVDPYPPAVRSIFLKYSPKSLSRQHKDQGRR